MALETIYETRKWWIMFSNVETIEITLLFNGITYGTLHLCVWHLWSRYVVLVIAKISHYYLVAAMGFLVTSSYLALIGFSIIFSHWLMVLDPRKLVDVQKIKKRIVTLTFCHVSSTAYVMHFNSGLKLAWYQPKFPGACDIWSDNVLSVSLNLLSALLCIGKSSARANLVPRKQQRMQRSPFLICPPPTQITPGCSFRGFAIFSCELLH